MQNRNVDSMTGVEFERYCIELLIKSGIFTRAQMTNVNNDYGADIVAVDSEGTRWVFQCKRYSGNVNNKSVQEVIASKAHYKATKAGVITNSWFTDNAKVLGRDNYVWLIDRAGMKQLEDLASEKIIEKMGNPSVGEKSHTEMVKAKIREKEAKEAEKRAVKVALVLGAVLIVCIVILHIQESSEKKVILEEQEVKQTQIQEEDLPEEETEVSTSKEKEQKDVSTKSSTPDMPYYGMPETEVENTKLGKADEREEEDMDKVKFYPTIIYKWYNDDEQLSFYVRCTRRRLNRDTNEYSKEFFVQEATLYDENRYPINIFTDSIQDYNSVAELEEYLMTEYDLDYVDEDDLTDFWNYMESQQ